MLATEHSLYSRYREALFEHIFAAEVMRHLWRRGNVRIEVLKPQVDEGGYDLVLEANGVVRHVQLKSSHHGSSTSVAKVSLHLARKPSGCVILTCPRFWYQSICESVDDVEPRFYPGPASILPVAEAVGDVGNAGGGWGAFSKACGKTRFSAAFHTPAASIAWC